MVLYDMALYDNRVSGRSRAGGEPVIGPARAPVRASQLSGVYKIARLDPDPEPDPDSGAAVAAARHQAFQRASGIIRKWQAAGGIS
jgi:hypothetical protein